MLYNLNYFSNLKSLNIKAKLFIQENLFYNQDRFIDAIRGLNIHSKKLKLSLGNNYKKQVIQPLLDSSILVRQSSYRVGDHAINYRFDPCFIKQRTLSRHKLSHSDHATHKAQNVCFRYLTTTTDDIEDISCFSDVQSFIINNKSFIVNRFYSRLNHPLSFTNDFKNIRLDGSNICLLHLPDLSSNVLSKSWIDSLLSAKTPLINKQNINLLIKSKTHDNSFAYTSYVRALLDIIIIDGIYFNSLSNMLLPILPHDNGFFIPANRQDLVDIIKIETEKFKIDSNKYVIKNL